MDNRQLAEQIIAHVEAQGLLRTDDRSRDEQVEDLIMLLESMSYKEDIT